jgi:alpha-glucosidase (family GH31 glycosyl hydrolase)
VCFSTFTSFISAGAARVADKYGQRYPVADMSAFIDQLHSDSMHYIPIVDPGIKTDPDYFAYQKLLASGYVHRLLSCASIASAVG